MSERSKLTLVAIACYVGLIVFIRIHPIGRQAELNLLMSPTPQAMAGALWMFATAVIFLYASKGQPARIPTRLGCLGGVIAVVAVLAAAFAGVIPKSWDKREAELFFANLITVSTVPFAFVFLAGFWKGRRSTGD